MIAMPNSHLILHKETLKQHKDINKISIKHLIRIINLGAKNRPVGRSGLRTKVSKVNFGCDLLKNRFQVYARTRPENTVMVYL